jgi:adenine C2-methylase RlmN of 23S rRNA A2503 and tRNA A37
VTPTIYYSLYSVDPGWRRKWLPAALGVEEALENLAEYQRVSKKLVRIHGAFIEGENDSDEHIHGMVSAIQKSGLDAAYNLVRYNPYSPEQGRESDRLDEIVEIIGRSMPIKVIPRVGTDVAASCGVFVGKDGSVARAA